MPDDANPTRDENDDGIFEIEGQPFTETRDLGKIATVIAGVAVGAMIGAGAALLLAPASGDETRFAIKQRVRKVTRRERGVWKSLARAMEEAAHEQAAKAKMRRVKAEAAVAGIAKG
jgi:hypothetical protein